MSSFILKDGKILGIYSIVNLKRKVFYCLSDKCHERPSDAHLSRSHSTLGSFLSLTLQQVMRCSLAPPTLPLTMMAVKRGFLTS